ncbi:FMN-binding negative transcriptional regulator [Kitasatospora sp. NPDC002040]|uniref:FMN-binding negative transcriptional regulator n=1 Tax=Kitasatospora sp. NPDC002040 TaxID=3154661 RepID=UPI00332B569D
MLIRSWDRGSEAEWRQWLSEGRDFGLLAANGTDGRGPVLVPTHFLLAGDEIVLHLGAPNPIWAAIRADPAVTLAVTDDYAFAAGGWRGDPYVPTSYYASVHFSCTAEPVDEPAGKADILDRQLAHFEPDWPGAAPVTPGQQPYGPLLSGIRGLRLAIDRVDAKFKYDDKKPVEQQAGFAERLAERGTGRDAGARAQLLRRNALRTGCPLG